MDLLVDKFLSKHPEHAARLLSTVSEDAFLSLMNAYSNHTEIIISNMSPSYVAKAFGSYSDDSISKLCLKLSGPYIATILKHMSRDKRDTILGLLETSKKKVVSELLIYTEEQVGHYVESTELVLSENLLVHDAMKAIESISTLHHPIYIVDSRYKLIGTLDLFSVIKIRDDKNITIKNLINKRIISFKASITIQNVFHHSVWTNNKSIPVVGKYDNLLGVISKASLSENIKSEPIEGQRRDSFNEYIYFSEFLWNGLQKFWGLLR